MPEKKANETRRQPNGRFLPGHPATGGGRPPGVRNKATREIKAFARRVLENPRYLRNLMTRIRAGEANHMELFLAQHAYGKPKEVVAFVDMRPHKDASDDWLNTRLDELEQQGQPRRLDS